NGRVETVRGASDPAYPQRQGPDPGRHGGGAGDLALLPEPDRAQPAAADRAIDPETRLDLQGRAGGTAGGGRRDVVSAPRGVFRSAARRRIAGRPGTDRGRGSGAK